jgi:hypothetical protein
VHECIGASISINMRASLHLVLSRSNNIHTIQPKHLLHTACMANDGRPVVEAAGLARYMTRLTQDEQADAHGKFVAAGYDVARQDLVTRLGNQELAEIGIQPQAVRSALLEAFSLAGESIMSMVCQAFFVREHILFLALMRRPWQIHCDCGQHRSRRVAAV